ncbi:hypothetical protein FB45DRAFT_209423 [Roridomyces roridus]|uniref:F-box domain-containing protein n=1 Tax=Roridomyces roridus TaxID=1738132 RepID=A0AAD7G0H6_9AGAR|nr:hypothetical protein FB45DRAFT_209423 [Roridomyces roridus]
MPLSLDGLPTDILLQIVALLGLGDIVSLSLVNKTFNGLSQEHSFWLTPLLLARLERPLPCPNLEDLSVHTTKELKRFALDTLRLARNWSEPFPQIVGPIKSFPSGRHSNILFCLPDAIVLYCLSDGTVICHDLQTGVNTEPFFVGRINDMSSLLEEPEGLTVAALVDNQEIVVLTTSSHPNLSISLKFRRPLDLGFQYSAVFMNSTVVGVARSANGSEPTEIQSFNRLVPSISSTIVTDRPPSPVMGSSVIGDTVYFIFHQLSDPHALVYACPPRLLAQAPPQPNVDYSVQRSHIARIPRPLEYSQEERNMRAYCVLSTEPHYGQNTISIAYSFGHELSPAMEITFWPRPRPLARTTFATEEGYEKAIGRLMQPARTLAIPGTLSNQPNTAWELIVSANSGLALILVVDPPPPPSPPVAENSAVHDGAQHEANADPDAEVPPPPLPPPKLLLARYDPILDSASLHELQLPSEFDTRQICAVALDDHSGFAILITADNIVHYIPYA